MSGLLTELENTAARETSVPDDLAEAAGRSLCDRIRASGRVRPVFIVGPPRSGTTLMARILAHSDDVLSLSEPFCAWRVMPAWMSKPFFCWLQYRFQQRMIPPKSDSPAAFFDFIRQLALGSHRGVLVIKEVYHDAGLPPLWFNVDLLDEVAQSGAPVIAVMRDPFDTVASTMELVSRYVWGWCGFALRRVLPSFPRFTDEAEVVRCAARNWAQYAEWIRRHRLFVIRYEDLVGNPATEVERVCAYAGIPFDERMLSASNRPAAFAGIIGDPGVLLRAPRPVHAQSIGRARTLPSSQRAIIRECCDQIASEFGYPL